MLPEVKKVPLTVSVFPKPFQTVIFRNYGLIATERIARVLSCDTETVEKEAARLGLSRVNYDGVWEKRGFITVIRNNWYLLPYDQLMTLLDYDENRLEFILKNEDFLFVKLGFFKPFCEKISYEPLSAEEIAETERLAKEIEPRLAYKARPFSFFEEEDAQPLPIVEYDGIRLLHGYLSLCGDAFIEDSESYFPDSLFLEYQKNGVTGVWLHGVLAALSPYPFDPKQSEQYELRRKNLAILAQRAARYGIKVYLYLNEPRALPEEKLGKNAYLAGRRQDGLASLCFENAEVRDYLYNAVKDLLRAVPELGGFVTITMSENATHCNWAAKEDCNCPVCRDIPQENTAAAVNNCIMKAVRDAKTGARVLAFLWGWSDHLGWTNEQVAHGIQQLDPEITVVVTSEYGCETKVGGIKSKVVDYSLAHYGPSPLAKLSFREAKKRGCRIAAKIQVNNSWECAATPYIPVFDLLHEHLTALYEEGVKNYMLTWTLGGYPAPMHDLVSRFAEDPEGFSLDAWYEAQYGADAKKVHAAVKEFCDGLLSYPYSIRPLYDGPKTLGPANPWSLYPSENASTMVCYAFDDYERWTDPYPYDIYIAQMEKLLSAFERGLVHLEGIGESEKTRELRIAAETAYVHYKADLLHTRFSYEKRDIPRYRKSLLSLLNEERAVTEKALSLWEADPAVAFEASNHYFYNDRDLVEKFLATEQMARELNENI